MLIEVPWSRARDLVKSGRVTVDGRRIDDATVRPRVGAVVEVNPMGRRIGSLVLDDADVIHLDDEVIVVHKAAGALTVPTEEGERDTLVDRVKALLRSRGLDDDAVGIVHRLDRDTSGLVVFARNFNAKRALSEQFQAHSIARHYLALAHGRVTATTHDTMLIRDRGDGLRGSAGRPYPGQARRAKESGEAQRAVTHVVPIAELADATLVQCRLETGRQHQIRIHLAESGHMVLGESVYVRDHRGPKLAAPRLMLHATALGFTRPSGGWLSFVQAPPEDFTGTYARLTGKRAVMNEALASLRSALTEPSA